MELFAHRSTVLSSLVSISRILHNTTRNLLHVYTYKDNLFQIKEKYGRVNEFYIFTVPAWPAPLADEPNAVALVDKEKLRPYKPRPIINFFLGQP